MRHRNPRRTKNEVNVTHINKVGIMLNDIQSQELMNKLISLRSRADLSKEDKRKYMKHQELCIQSYSYIIGMRCSRYKEFNNYEDLMQEGNLALVNALKTYDPNKGSAFWWIHKYVDTRIARRANQHTTIRYPIHLFKENSEISNTKDYVPMSSLPEESLDNVYESIENKDLINKGLSLLNDKKRFVLTSIYGLNGEKELSLTKCCKKLSMSKADVLQAIEDSCEIIRSNITI